MVTDTAQEDAKRQVAQAIANYGVPAWVAHVSKETRDLVPNEFIVECRSRAQKSIGWGRQSDGRDAIIEWAINNTFAETTVKELAEIGKVSEATARTVISERPDIFRRSEWGKYEVRDPEADRAADKA